ncbi:MAG: hypothetical protein OEW86_06140 [Nitrosopumilus sp.]|nr:hypothetical protein [Nitrosopumilus sp.]MDH3516835.1 hypothetical protein [Nitrosopumilus sp.]MDH3565213.1 hypothetical protein [Nitrosopumilus sp.]MDH5417558.1 hypothetical protein [Nitrosopumilus sp.]
MILYLRVIINPTKLISTPTTTNKAHTRSANIVPIFSGKNTDAD